MHKTVVILLFILLTTLFGCSTNNSSEMTKSQAEAVYAKTLAQLKDSKPDASQPIYGKPTEVEEQFLRALMTLKTVNEYTQDDSYFSAIILQKKGDYKQAVDLCSGVIAAAPESTQFYLLRSKGYMGLSLDAEAIRDCNTAYDIDKLKAQEKKYLDDIAADPQKPIMHYYLVEFYITELLTEKAIQSMKQAPAPRNFEEKAGEMYINCVVQGLLGHDTAQCERDLQKLFDAPDADDEYMFTFDVLSRWVRKNRPPAHAREAITRMTKYMQSQSDE